MRTPRFAVRASAAAIAVVIAAAEMVLDFGTYIELNVAILYVLPLLFAAASRSRALLWTLASLLASVALTVYVLQSHSAIFTLRDPYFIDRALAIGSMLITAGLLHALMGTFDALDARHREAAEASGLKTRLLGALSHDLRTPLTSLHLVADLIQRMAEDRKSAVPELRRLSDELQGSTASLSELVVDAFEVSQIDAGRLVLQDSAFNLDELVASECRALASAAAEKSLSLTHVPWREPLWISADRVKLARVIRNLMVNAIKFTDVGGVTAASSLEPDGAIRIRVTDTGVGIDPAMADYVFDEFARLRPEDAGRSGWGLGLSICRRLTTLLGGTVRFEANPQGGTTFYVELPAWRALQSKKLA